MTLTSTTASSTTSDLFLRHRLKIIEDLWEAVLRQECGQELVDLLNQLRDMCSPEGQAPTFIESEVLKVIERLDLNEAIRAARAFALYFQLINIVEQHYEQRDQQLHYRAARDTASSAIIARTRPNYSPSEPNGETSTPSGRLEADLLEKVCRTPTLARKWAHFTGCFPSCEALTCRPSRFSS